MTEFENGYEQGYKDGMASAALPNVLDNGDKIDGYSYAYKTDSNGEPYIHIDSVRSILKKAADVQPVVHGKWDTHDVVKVLCSGKTLDGFCQCEACGDVFPLAYSKYNFCPNCGARMEQEG